MMGRTAVLTMMMLATTAASAATPAYKAAGSIPLGAPDRWDYIVLDPDSGRVYVAHSDTLTVVDGRSAILVGRVEGISGGAHGTALSAATGQGFTDDGRNGVAVAFDLKTLKINRQIPADKDADAIASDASNGHMFVIEGDPGAITVIDPKTDQAVATIKVGEKMEYGVGDDRGALYVAGEEKHDLVRIDTRTNQVTAHWAAPTCDSPHGLALDRIAHRAFMGCVNNRMMVFDTVKGRVVAELTIGKGSDAIAFDPVRKRVFSSNGGDGTITVYQQVSPDRYTALEPIPTAISGRTMTVDPKTGRLFVAAADTDPNPTPGGRPRPRPGTLRLMMFDPTG